ncbi:MAG: outer membrane protein assembly factor BamA [Rickettsiaceae bacterium]|nr:outer membrane protein assembly factor BamA [Rickettsiaceae bacterium]
MRIIIQFFILITLFISTISFAEIVKEIKVSGNSRIEKSSIINYLHFKVGQEYTEEKESGSIKDLYDTHIFDKISINFTRGIAEVDVKETPLVVKVSSKGNSRIKSSTIAKEILTTKGSSLSKANIKLDIDRIKDLYRKSGRYSVSVNAQIEELSNNRVAVVFAIKEGPKTGIRYINFVGNKNYSDSELRYIIASKQSAWFRFMDSSDTYDPERFEYDKYLLKRFYNSLGFADFRVISTLPEISQAKDYFVLTYTIEEGKKYNIGDISLESQIQEIDTSQLQKLVTIKSGSLYNANLLESISEKINEKLADLGYQGATTDTNEDKNFQKGIVNIKFVILKASKVRINKINIDGNLKTRDNVIRRQMKLQEGDLFNRSAVNKSQQNLRDLDYFENIDVDIAPAEEKNNTVDLNVSVEEKSTASVHLEFGMDSVQGPLGRVNFTETNLLGTGKHFTIDVEKTEKKLSESIGIADPYFMDRDLLAGINLYHSQSGRSKQSQYDIKNDAISVRLGYEIADSLRHDIMHVVKVDKLTGPTAFNRSIYIHEQYGKIVTSALANTLTYDRRDSALVPKNGFVISGTETVAGIGGDAKYLKHEANAKYFYSFWNNSYTFRISADVGTIHGYQGSKVAINERFNLGDYLLRGFEMSGIGPRDKRTLEALGGQNMYKITAELQFPLGLPKEYGISGAIFYDVGALWGFDVKTSTLYSKADVYDNTDPRMSYGVGLIWMTRFAPIRIDYAVPFRKKNYDITQHWHFRMSASF